MHRHLRVFVTIIFTGPGLLNAQIDNVDEQIYPDPITCFAMADHLYGGNSGDPDHLIRMSLPGGDGDVDYPNGPTVLNGNSTTTLVEAIEFVTQRNKLYAANGNQLVFSEGPNFNNFQTCGTLPYPDVDGLAFDGFDQMWYGISHTGTSQADQIFSFQVDDNCNITLVSPAVAVESVSFAGRMHNTASDLAINHSTGELLVTTISDGGGNTAVSIIDPLNGTRFNTTFLNDRSDFHNETIYGIEGFTSTPDNYFLVSTGINAKGYHREELFALVLETGQTFEQQDLDDEQPIDISVYADTEAIACGQPNSYQNLQLGNKVFFDLNDDGVQQGDEPAVPNLDLVVWRDTDGDGYPNYRFKSTRSDAQGEFLFDRMGEGDFVIQIPCTEFELGAPLEGYVTSSAISNPNSDVNKDNNGYFDEFGLCAVTLAVNLSFGDEPGAGGEANTTVDIGLVPGVLSTERVYEEIGGILTMEAEEFESQDLPSGADVWEIERSISGAQQGVYLVPLDDDGTKIEEDYDELSPELRYHVYFNTPGTYYIWYRGYGLSADQNSIHMGLNGRPLDTMKDIGFSVYNEWTWVNLLDDGSRARVEIPSAGEYIINMWEREDGTKVDRMVFTTSAGFVPAGIGPSESPKNNKSVSFGGEILLSGAWNGTDMRTDIQASGLLPSQSPYALSPQTPASMNQANLVDWVRIELRTGASASTKVAERAAYLLNNGEIRDWDGSSQLTFYGLDPGSYFVIADHKSHLPAMTKTAIDFSSGSASFDFSNSLVDLFGASAAQVVDGKVQLWPGDVNNDNSIKYAGSSNDRVEILTPLSGPTAFATISAYSNADINMDGKVAYSGANNDRVLVLETLSGNPSAFNVKNGTVPQ